ncbi:MAG: SIMPL domain-containing protein [Gammaproteobacteria bacterium]
MIAVSEEVRRCAQEKRRLNDLGNGYTLIDEDRRAIVKALVSRGIAEEDMTIQPASTLTQYGNDGQPTGYELQQGMYVVSRDISKIEDLTLNPGAFFERGLAVQFSLEYYLANLSDTKRTLLAEATRDARRRAAEIAENSGAEIGEIASARSGVFQITEPYSTEVSDYGIYSTATRLKDITVTVHVSFTLK